MSGKEGKEATEATETTEADIAVHWGEEQYFYPSAKFIAQANMTDEKIYDRMSLDKCPEYWKEYADLLTWYKYWDTILDTSDAPCYNFFQRRVDQRKLQLC